MTHAAKIATIATAFRNAPEIKPHEARLHKEIVEDMTKTLNKEFVDKCYNALVQGKAVVFSYDSDLRCYGFLAGPDRTTVLDAMKAVTEGNYKVTTINPKVGEVYQCKTGEILKFEKLNPKGKFAARVKSIKTGEWTDYRLEGQSSNLPGFLAENEAIKLDPKDHPEPDKDALH